MKGAAGGKLTVTPPDGFDAPSAATIQVAAGTNAPVDIVLSAVETAPDYHVAVAGLASVRAAQGRIDDAIELYERAVTLVPEPTTLAALGDLYSLTGNDRAAADRYATVEASASLQATNRALYDRQLAHTVECGAQQGDDGPAELTRLVSAEGRERENGNPGQRQTIAWPIRPARDGPDSQKYPQQQRTEKAALEMDQVSRR